MSEHLTKEEILKKLKKLREENKYNAELFGKGYGFSEPGGMISYPESLETAYDLDEIIIGYGYHEDNPFGRAVYARDKQGNGIKLRDIIGDDYEVTKLPYGEFISVKDFKEALERELNYDSSDTIYVAWRTGQTFSKNALIKDILKTVLKNSVYLKANYGMTKQNAYYEELTMIDPTGEKTIKTDLGRFPIDRKKVKIGDGKYVSAFEIEKALTAYVKMDKRTRDIGTMGGASQPGFDSDELDESVDKKTGGKTGAVTDSIDIEEPKKKGPTIGEIPSVGPKPRGDNTPTSNGNPTGGDTPIGDDTPTGSGNKSETDNATQDEIYDVVLRKGKVPNKFLKLLSSLLLIILLLLSGLEITDEKVQEKYTEFRKTASYSVTELEEVKKYIMESEDEVVKRIMSDIIVDHQAYVEPGVLYHESSDYDRGGKNATGTFGKGIRPSGEYNVDSISIILPSGEIVDTWETDTNLDKYIETVSQTYNIPVEDLTVRIHLGSPVAGWVDFEDIGSKEEKEPQVKQTQIVLEEQEKISGVQKDFDGETITFNNGEKDVTLKITDENGNLLPYGSIVTGSDGVQYKVTDLTVIELATEATRDVGTKKALRWSIHNIELEEVLGSLALAGLVAALGYALRKNETEMATLSEEEINYLVKSAERRYASTSEFAQAVETLTGRSINPELESELGMAAQTLKDSLIDQDITIENVGDMGGPKR